MSDHKMLKQQFIKDMALNIIATALPIALLNFLIYPIVADHLGSAIYGTVTASIGILNFSNGIWGSSVAHSVLLYQGKKEKKNVFLPIFTGQMILGTGFSLVILQLTGCIVSWTQAAILLMAGCFLMCNNYMTVEYRLRLSYINILMNNLLNCVGYIIGYLIFIGSGGKWWEFIFLSGFGLPFLYAICTTSIWKGKFDIDKETFQSARKCAVLVSTSTISGTSTYLDKLVIYPVLGSESMAYYQAAGVFVKIIPLMASAISNVILSYLVRIVKISKKYILTAVMLLFGIGTIGVLICDVIVPYIVRFLYPSFYEECRKYIYYTNIIAMLQMCYSFLFPFSLRYAKRTTQFLIQIGRLIPYVAGCFFLIPAQGLTGFCYATIISQIIQIGIIIFVVMRVEMVGKNELVSHD